MKILVESALIVAGLGLVAGCATSGSTLVVGDSRAPVAKADVVVLTEFPAEYEVIALLESEDGGANFNSAEKTQQLCLEDLKKRAAAVGANGLVLTKVGEKDSGAFLMPSGNGAILANSTKVHLTGTAIRF